MIPFHEEDESPIEWFYDGGRYRIDYALIRSIERSIEGALELAEETGEDMLEIPFCGCDTCVSRTIIGVTIARTLDGSSKGMVEMVKDE